MSQLKLESLLTELNEKRSKGGESLCFYHNSPWGEGERPAGTENPLIDRELGTGGGSEVRVKQADSDRLQLGQSLFYISVAVSRANHFCIDICPKSIVCLMMVAGFIQDTTELKKGCLMVVAVRIKLNLKKHQESLHSQPSHIFPGDYFH